MGYAGPNYKGVDIKLKASVSTNKKPDERHLKSNTCACESRVYLIVAHWF